jgi:hypothetical protein
MIWNDEFLALFARCLSAYQAGNQDFTCYYDQHDQELLHAIGYQPRELFDFVEDFAEQDEPSISTALLIAAARRDYFQTEQKSIPSDRVVSSDDVPAFEEEMDGMAYLPRILAKGRAKLRGELHPDLMFDCGGDRRFLKEHGDIHPADFLRNLWAAGDDDAKICAWVKEQQD